jgi:hypothetical protein
LILLLNAWVAVLATSLSFHLILGVPEKLDQSRAASVTPYTTDPMKDPRLSSEEMPWSMENFLFNAVISTLWGGAS